MNNEQGLLEQLKAGSAEAFSQLHRQYSVQMYANVLKMVKDEQVAEEIVQDIFTRIWQKRESIQIEHSFAAYIYRIAQNLVIDFYRKLKRERNLYNRFKAAATENYSHIEEALHDKEYATLLQNALDILPPQQKKVYQLCSLDGHSYKEAGSHLGISPLTVKEHLSKAKSSIRQFINNRMDTAFGIAFFALIDEVFNR
ncbi:MAG: RNA polymerase sigma-70 factor [Bacteroidetes bacterium]|nr:RNA polymerase sigma-70 factor [Bacteroidota bacterium]